MSDTFYKRGSLAILVFLTCGWYVSYVKPRDEFMSQVYSCMDQTHAEVKTCASKVRGHF